MQKIIIAMMDGFGMDYYTESDIPFIHSMANQGFFKNVQGMFPSVTNANNISIATGTWPCEHGISANSIYDPASNQAVYLNTSKNLRVHTVLERARSNGKKTALLTCKKKSKELFAGRADMVFAAEDMSEEEKGLFGEAPPIYSLEINHFLWDCVAKLLETDETFDVLYVHTTDYPMHSWEPTHEKSIMHLKGIDSRMKKIYERNPDCAFFITADHGMNFKKRNWDLQKVCKANGVSLAFALSPERDYYYAHHKNYTGCAWLWLQRKEDREQVISLINDLEGVESVRDSHEVAKEFNLNTEHLGDLVVFADKDTMFGDADSELELLDSTYRAHGSLHEMNLPLIIYNFQGPLPNESFFSYNKDLVKFLFNEKMMEKTV